MWTTLSLILLVLASLACGLELSTERPWRWATVALLLVIVYLWIALLGRG